MNVSCVTPIENTGDPTVLVLQHKFLMPTSEWPLSIVVPDVKLFYEVLFISTDIQGQENLLFHHQGTVFLGYSEDFRNYHPNEPMSIENQSQSIDSLSKEYGCPSCNDLLAQAGQDAQRQQDNDEHIPAYI